MQPHTHGQAAPGNVMIDQIPYLRLEGFHFARQRHRDFTLLPVHGADFDGDLEPFTRTLPTAVSGH